MMSLDYIAVPCEADIISLPLSELGASHGLTVSRGKMYERYYGLRTVPQTMKPHGQMLASALSRLAECCSFPRDSEGLIVYAKTQTHNTLFESDWLHDLSCSQGLHHWEWLTVSMNHCASALSVIHLLKSMAEHRLIVLLTGEKSFHPAVSRLSIGVLGEMPVATLLNAGLGRWAVAATAVVHEPRFYENPDDMVDSDRAALQERFDVAFEEFIDQALVESRLYAEEVDLVVPYNLNLPLLRRIASRFGWRDKLYVENIPSAGHTYCSDVLFNFARVLPVTSARKVMAFAAGMGLTFSSLTLERC